MEGTKSGGPESYNLSLFPVLTERGGGKEWISSASLSVHRGAVAFLEAEVPLNKI